MQRPTTSCKRSALQNCGEMTHRDGTFRLGSRGWLDKDVSLNEIASEAEWMHVEARSVLFSGL